MHGILRGPTYPSHQRERMVNLKPDALTRRELCLQNAIDNEEKRHVIDYASDFRASRYQQRREMTEDSAGSFLATHRPNRSISFT